MKKFILYGVVVLLSACAAKMVKVDGDQSINSRMSVKVSQAWNKLEDPNRKQPYDLWTQEGVTLDQLRFWAAIPSGGSLVAPPPRPPSGQTAPRSPTFVASMQAEQLVSLFETMYAMDGSLVSVNTVTPGDLGGKPGVRIEFTITRKSDSVMLTGVTWAVVHKNELFAASFVAPRLAFFPRLAPNAETVVKTARISG